jgi:hypothetical protein
LLPDLIIVFSAFLTPSEAAFSTSKLSPLSVDTLWLYPLNEHLQFRADYIYLKITAMTRLSSIRPDVAQQQSTKGVIRKSMPKDGPG